MLQNNSNKRHFVKAAKSMYQKGVMTDSKTLLSDTVFATMTRCMYVDAYPKSCTWCSLLQYLTVPLILQLAVSLLKSMQKPHMLTHCRSS